MSKGAVATKEDIEDILQVLNAMMANIDQRFNGVEKRLDNLEGGMGRLEGRLDRLDNRVGVLEEKSTIVAYQLTRLADWAEEAGDYIGIPYAR
jgi:archaellum component FlaC